MTNYKVLPNHYYRIVAYSAAMIILVMAETLRTKLWVMGIMFSGTVINAELAVFIKKYKHNPSVIIELAQASLLPYCLYTYSLAAHYKAEDFIYFGVGVAILSVMYIGVLIKINNRQWLTIPFIKKALATGLYNIRLILLIYVSIHLIYLTVTTSFAIKNPNQMQVANIQISKRIESFSEKTITYSAIMDCISNTNIAVCNNCNKEGCRG